MPGTKKLFDLAPLKVTVGTNLPSRRRWNKIVVNV